MKVALGLVALTFAKIGFQKSSNKLVSMCLSSRSSIILSRLKPSTPSLKSPSPLGSVQSRKNFSKYAFNAGDFMLTVVIPVSPSGKRGPIVITNSPSSGLVLPGPCQIRKLLYGAPGLPRDRQSGVSGKSVSVRLDAVGRRIHT